MMNKSIMKEKKIQIERETLVNKIIRVFADHQINSVFVFNTTVACLLKIPRKR